MSNKGMMVVHEKERKLEQASEFRAAISASHCIPNWSNNYISFLSSSRTTIIPSFDMLYDRYIVVLD